MKNDIDAERNLLVNFVQKHLPVDVDFGRGMNRTETWRKNLRGRIVQFNWFPDREKRQFQFLIESLPGSNRIMDIAAYASDCLAQWKKNNSNNSSEVNPNAYKEVRGIYL